MKSLHAKVNLTSEKKFACHISIYDISSRSSSTMISDCILTQFVIDHYCMCVCVQFLAAVNLYFSELITTS